MSVEVELQFFSGIPNPRWTLSPPEEHQFKAHLAGIRTMDLTSRAAPVIKAPPADSGPAVEIPTTGYMGFRTVVDGRPPILVFGDRVVNFAPGERTIEPGQALDAWLFNTQGQFLDDEYGITPYVLMKKEPVPIEGISEPSPSAQLAYGPTTFAPAPWMQSPYLGMDRCYNYANDVMTPNTVSPPVAADNVNAVQLRHALHDDHLTLFTTGLPTLSPDATIDESYIAACLHLHAPAKKKGDYHFFRLDHDGTWSHKDGGNAPVNTDANGDVIGDLSQAVFSTPFTLVGFFSTNRDVRTALTVRGQ